MSWEVISGVERNLWEWAVMVVPLWRYQHRHIRHPTWLGFIACEFYLNEDCRGWVTVCTHLCSIGCHQTTFQRTTALPTCTSPASWLVFPTSSQATGLGVLSNLASLVHAQWHLIATSICLSWLDFHDRSLSVLQCTSFLWCHRFPKSDHLSIRWVSKPLSTHL